MVIVALDRVAARAAVSTVAGGLAELITAGAQRFLGLAEHADPASQCETPWYGTGVTRTPDCLTALALTELTVHGYDVAAEVRAVGDQVDCVISAAPAALLLVAYGRLPIWRALLRGGVLSSGRRPWLGLRFNDYFVSP